MKYFEQFKEHYVNWFSTSSTTTLVKQERLLSELIDSDLFPDLVLCDEIVALYEIVRDECVERVANLVEIENDFNLLCVPQSAT